MRILLVTDWPLALIVLLVIPIIGITFFFVLTRVRKLFRKSQEALDWLNKVINESIVGAALIRLLDSTGFEFGKFVAANGQHGFGAYQRIEGAFRLHTVQVLTVTADGISRNSVFLDSEIFDAFGLAPIIEVGPAA